MIEFKTGDAIQAFQEYDGKAILLHGCNCFQTMGAGIAKQIVAKYPDILRVDIEKTKYGSHKKLGKYTAAIVETDADGNMLKIIANGYTQYHYGRGNLFVDSALTEVIIRLARDYQDYPIFMPYIGAGLAGGTKTDTRAAIGAAFDWLAKQRRTDDHWSEVQEPTIYLYEKD